MTTIRKKTPRRRCVCGSAEHTGFMICCDGCNSWMHGACFKVTQRSSRGLETFYCSHCRCASATATSLAAERASTITSSTSAQSKVRTKIAEPKVTTRRGKAEEVATATTGTTAEPRVTRRTTRAMVAESTSEPKPTTTTAEPKARARTVNSTATASTATASTATASTTEPSGTMTWVEVTATAPTAEPIIPTTSRDEPRVTRRTAKAAAKVTESMTEPKPTATTTERRSKSRSGTSIAAAPSPEPKATTARPEPMVTKRTAKPKATSQAKSNSTITTMEPMVKTRRAPKAMASTTEPNPTTTTAELTAKSKTAKAKFTVPTTESQPMTTTKEPNATKRRAKSKVPASPIQPEATTTKAGSRMKARTAKPKVIARTPKPQPSASSKEREATTRTAEPKVKSRKQKVTVPTPRPTATTTTSNSKSTTTKAKLKATPKAAKATTPSNDRKRGLLPTSSSTTDSPSAKRRKTKAVGAPEAPGTGSAMVEQSLLSHRPAFVFVIQTSRLLKLSDEILIWILIWVHCQKSICRVSSTCKRLWSVAQDPYLWKYITLHHDTVLRRHWDTQLHPRLLSSNIYELNLVGEISSPVLIDTLKLDQFTGLRTLRLEDIQTYTVYRLASRLPWLKVFEARKIKGNSDRWDWSPFSNLNQLEELLLWRNEKPMQTFSLSEDMMIETPDDVYPGDGVNGGFGGFVQLSNSNSPMLDSDDEMAEDDVEDGGDEVGTEDAMDTEGSVTGSLEEGASIHSNQGLGAGTGGGTGTGTGGSDNSGVSITPVNQNQQQHRQRQRRMMPKLKRLALINIVSPTAHRGTDSVMRSLVSRVSTFVHWNSFNILFPVVRTQFNRLVHLTMVEPCEPAWQEATWQEHAAAFLTMKSLQTVTWINPHMQRRFLIPILDVLLLSLDRLRVIHLVSTDDDTQVLQMILTHVLETQWTGQLTVSIQDDLGADPLVRDWCDCAREAVRVANLDDAMKNQPLAFVVKLFRAEWDEDAGLKRLCLKAWQQTLR